MAQVLIVEDDSGIAEFLQLELEHEGYAALYAADGRSALEMFEKNAPDIVLLDIMLPELNGLEVLRRRKSAALT
ncbi:response regulator [Treponema vincentii]|uniref:response regulator n=1 Tax=Treponema vincentii TaxID=69710 RepID=UPI003D8BDE01